MGRARAGAVAACLSAAAAVAVALVLTSRPATDRLFFAPPPFTAQTFVAASGCVGLVWAGHRRGPGLAPSAQRAGLVDPRRRRLARLGGRADRVRRGRLQQAVLSWPRTSGPRCTFPAGWCRRRCCSRSTRTAGCRAAGGAGRSAPPRPRSCCSRLCVPFPTVGPRRRTAGRWCPSFPAAARRPAAAEQLAYDVADNLSSPPRPARWSRRPWWARSPASARAVFKPLLVLSMLTIWVGTVVRLVRARPPRRQQLAWLVCAVMPLLAASLVAPVEFANVLVLVVAAARPGGGRGRGAALPAARHRDRAPPRAGLRHDDRRRAGRPTCWPRPTRGGAALDSPRVPGVVAAALAAVGLAPARDRLQRAADRLVYGERRDPLRAVTLLGDRVAAGGELDLLPGGAGQRGRRGARARARRWPRRTAGCSPRSAPRREPPAPARCCRCRSAASWSASCGSRAAPRRAVHRRPTRLLAALALQVAVVVRAARADRGAGGRTGPGGRRHHHRAGPAAPRPARRARPVAVRRRARPAGARTTGSPPATRRRPARCWPRIRDEVDTAVDRGAPDHRRPAAGRAGRRSGCRTRSAGTPTTVSASVPVEVEAADLPALPPAGGDRRVPDHHRGADQRRPARPGQRAPGSRLAARTARWRSPSTDDGRGVGPRDRRASG